MADGQGSPSRPSHRGGRGQPRRYEGNFSEDPDGPTEEDGEGESSGSQESANNGISSRGQGNVGGRGGNGNQPAGRGRGGASAPPALGIPRSGGTAGGNGGQGGSSAATAEDIPSDMAGNELQPQPPNRNANKRNAEDEGSQQPAARRRAINIRGRGLAPRRQDIAVSARDDGQPPPVQAPLPAPAPQPQDAVQDLPDYQDDDETPGPNLRVHFVHQAIREGTNQRVLIANLVDKPGEARAALMKYQQLASNQPWKSIRGVQLPSGERTALPAITDRLSQRGGSSGPGYRFGISKENRRAWLGNEPNWNTRIGGDSGHVWRGVKLLGRGGFGTVGLWQRDPLAEGQEDKNETVGLPKGLEKLVVKEGTDERMMKYEGFWQNLLSDRSQHIVRAWERNDFAFIRDTARGTRGDLYEDCKIIRILMEYCEEGDLTNLLKKIARRTTKKKPLEEKYCWLLLECLASALVTMEHGSEALDGDSWESPFGPLIHYDIKPDNILVGSKNEDHTQTPVLKLSDFGLTEYVDAGYPEILNRTRGGGTRGWNPPEQNLDYKYRYKRIHTSAMNVWQMGKIFWRIINRNRSRWCYDKLPKKLGGTREIMLEHPEWFLLQPDPEKPENVRTMGEEILHLPYSVNLRCTALMMLTMNWEKRITSRELLHICRKNIEVCNDAERILNEQAGNGNSAAGLDDEDVGMRVFGRRYGMMAPDEPPTGGPPPGQGPPVGQVNLTQQEAAVDAELGLLQQRLLELQRDSQEARQDNGGQVAGGLVAGGGQGITDSGISEIASVQQSEPPEPPEPQSQSRRTDSYQPPSIDSDPDSS